jgi:subtilisin-like proprotein convertase family protein
MKTARLFFALVVLGTLSIGVGYGQPAPWEYWNPAQAPITDFATTNSSMTITDVFSITSMQVMVDIQHTSASDLTIVLTGPQGSYILSMNNGSVYDNYENTIFDPAVAAYPCSGPIPANAAVPGEYINSATNQTAYFRGVYKPQPGTVFPTSGSPVGTWTLSVVDNALGDNGVLRKWGLIFNGVTKYKDVRWGWDINFFNKCGMVSGSRLPAPWVNDWNAFPMMGFYPYRVHGFRPVANQLVLTGLLQNSKTTSATNVTLQAQQPGGPLNTIGSGEQTLNTGNYWYSYILPVGSVAGNLNLTATIYQRGDLFMSRNDNTLNATIPLTAGSLGYDAGVAVGSNNTPFNNCEASVFAIDVAQTLTSVDIWQGASVELEPTNSAARINVKVWDASFGVPGTIIASAGARQFPKQGGKWVTYDFTPPIILPAGRYAFGLCQDVATATAGGVGLGTDRQGSPFDINGNYSRLYNLGIEFFSQNGGTVWTPEFLRVLSGKMIRPNFILGTDVGVISIDAPPASLPNSFAPQVTFGSFANHPMLPNLESIGKVYVIDNSSNQVVRYSERRVFLQNAPYMVTITFDTFTGLAAGSYTIRAEIQRFDDENLVNNTYSRQYTKTFAPVIVSSNRSIPSSLRSEIEANFASMDRVVKFVDRTQPGWSMPSSGEMLWIGTMSSNDADAIRTFVKNGNTFSVLPSSEFAGDVETNVYAAVASSNDKDIMTKTIMNAKSAPVPEYHVDALSRMVSGMGFLPLGKTSAEVEQGSVMFSAGLAELQNRMASVAKLPKISGASRQISFNQSEELRVEGQRLGSLSVARVIMPKIEKAYNVIDGLTSPSSFAMTQNYPNPFNPTTNIAYNLPQDAKVNMHVFDLLGRHVATLVNGSQMAGKYIVNWNGRGDNREEVASGIYFYRLEASTADGAKPFVSTKKMILSR